MAVIAEDVTFPISEDISFALPMAASEAVGADVAEWLAEAGLSESDIEADVGTWLANMGSGALNFGTAGASVGGPWGALIGGLLGAGLGAVQAATTPDKPAGGQTPAPQAPPRPAAAASQPAAAEKPPMRTIQNQPDTSAALLNALRDALPALTVIAQQLNNRPRTESTEDVAATEVAEDWSLEHEWPYARDGVEVETEDAAREDVPVEQAVAEGEAYAGAALARGAGEEEQEEAEEA